MLPQPVPSHYVPLLLVTYVKLIRLAISKYFEVAFFIYQL